MMLDQTLASPGCRAHWIISRLRISSKTMFTTNDQGRRHWSGMHQLAASAAVQLLAKYRAGPTCGASLRASSWARERFNVLHSPDDVVRHNRVNILGADQRHEVLVVHGGQLRHDVALHLQQPRQNPDGRLKSAIAPMLEADLPVSSRPLQ